MANPIKETPVLYGKDARKFAAAIANPVPFPPEEVAEMYKAYEWFKRAVERGRLEREERDQERKLQQLDAV